MRNHPPLPLIISVCLSVVLCIAWKEYRVRPDGRVHIAVLDVGQGDSVLITGPHGQHILIDGGPDDATLTELGKRMSFFDRQIDILVLTHPHLDHLSSFPAILERYDVGRVIMTGVAADAAPYLAMVRVLQEKQIPVLIADPSQDVQLGEDFTLDVLWPPPMYAGQETLRDLNDTSVVAMLRFGNDSMLFTGDMESAEEYELLGVGENLEADILKIGHHGSRTSTSTGFLLAANPSLAVISAGRDNPFGHPHSSTIQRLKYFNIPTRATSWEGTIELEMDGL